MSRLRYCAILLTTIVLSACAIVPHGSDDEASFSNKQAVINLRNDASILSNQGQFDKAKASLERALRIEPNNPILWFDLAKLHAKTNDTSSAKNMALRAKNYAKEPYLKRRIEKFISAL